MEYWLVKNKKGQLLAVESYKEAKKINKEDMTYVICGHEYGEALTKIGELQTTINRLLAPLLEE